MLGPTALTYFVAGMPETKGSWIPLGGGRVKADNPREKGWAASVAWATKAACIKARHVADDRRYQVHLDFVLEPPPNRTRANKRDIDKLCRSILDALTALVWIDDEQVDALHVTKRVTIGSPSGVTISIVPFE